MPVDPRELTVGYVFANRNLGTAWGVLRDGREETWRCQHRPHAVPILAKKCAEAELERRLQGAQEVLWALHCTPCSVFWDQGVLTVSGPLEHDPGHWLARGLCPRCEVPGDQVRIAVLERQKASVR